MAYEFFDKSIGLLLNWNNSYGLIILTFILILLITIIYKYTSNQAELKRIREESIQIQKELKDHKDNPAKMMELQKKQFKSAFIDSFRHNMWPMMITIIPVGILFAYLRGYYVNMGNPKLLLGLSWWWIYLLSALIFSPLLRKILKVY